jgi:hypothetical protein
MSLKPYHGLGTLAIVFSVYSEMSARFFFLFASFTPPDGMPFQTGHERGIRHAYESMATGCLANRTLTERQRKELMDLLVRMETGLPLDAADEIARLGKLPESCPFYAMDGPGPEVCSDGCHLAQLLEFEANSDKPS